MSEHLVPVGQRTPAPALVLGAAAEVRLVRRLREAGCVFAEEEAAILLDSATAATQLERMVIQREGGLPLEQVVGWVGFAGLRLQVGPDVFVPRQRSTHLASLAIATAKAQTAPMLLEMCCGVAPIACAVHHAREVELHVSDLDARALAYARRNLPTSAGIHEGHLFDGVPERLRQRITLFVAVPPYVPTAAAEQLPREARDHEPAAALFSGPDGLDLTRELIEQAGSWLAPSGRGFFELHVTQCRVAAAHAAACGFVTRTHRSPDGHTAVLEIEPAH